jgi:hypothetical protein
MKKQVYLAAVLLMIFGDYSWASPGVPNENSLKKTATEKILETGSRSQSGSREENSMQKGSVQGILNAGHADFAEGPKIELHPGVYVLASPQRDNFERVLMVEKDINDANKFYAILLEKDQLQPGFSGTAKLYMGNPVRKGANLKLSPVSVTSEGELVAEADQRSNAPVLMVSLDGRGGSLRFPYLVHSTGDDQPADMQMRAASLQLPEFLNRAVDGFYAGDSNGDLSIQSGILSFRGSWVQQQYMLTPLNGMGGILSQLSNSNFNASSEQDETDTGVSALAFSFKSWGRPTMVILKPTSSPGSYQMKVFGTRGKSLMDFLAPGRLEPDSE